VDQPRTRVRVNTMALAISLYARLDQIPGTGHRGLSVHDGHYDVCFYEFPRRSEQTQAVLDAVGAWLDEVGHPDVTVEFRWNLTQSLKGKTRAEQPVLHWKYEDGPEDAGPDGSPDDVGPAWLQTQDSRGNVTSEPINDGQWIRRMEALMLAHANGYTVSLDE
jgi:hypothetical protein